MAEIENTSASPILTVPSVVAYPSEAVRQPARRTTQLRRRHRRLGPGKRIPYAQLVGPTLLLAIWALTSEMGWLDSRIIPAPWTVLQTAADRWESGKLQTDILISLKRAATGFGIGLSIGVVLALAAGLSRIGEALIDGTIQVKRAIPVLGLIPLFILWLGIGETFKVAIISLGVFTPIYINTHAALSGIDNRYVELAESVGLSRWQFIRQIVIPGALPGFFVGLRLAVVGSWLSLIVLEQINATSGLGYMMFKAQNYGQTDVIVVGLLIYAIFGFTSNEAVRFIERRALSWQRTLTN
jgi:sulfonate transport system permease protein